MPIIAIVGPSGKGKTTGAFPNVDIGIKGLNPKETVFMNISGKELPARGWTKMYAGDPKTGGNYLHRPNGKLVTETINYVSEHRPDIKNVVVDDAQYLAAFEFARRTAEKGYEKFNDIFNEAYKPLEAGGRVRPDLFVFYNYHSEVEKENTKIKTCGKMIDNSITIEGLFNEVLYAEVQQDFKAQTNKYFFRTQTNGDDSCKSRVGMFTSKLIPNDYGLVREAIEKYNKGE